MKFNYKGKAYDTSNSNRLQLTEDDDLKQVVISEYFDKSVNDMTPLDLRFQLALISARYETIISEITDDEISQAGAYPDWVLDEFDNKFERKLVE